MYSDSAVSDDRYCPPKQTAFDGLGLVKTIDEVVVQSSAPDQRTERRGRDSNLLNRCTPLRQSSVFLLSSVRLNDYSSGITMTFYVCTTYVLAVPTCVIFLVLYLWSRVYENYVQDMTVRTWMTHGRHRLKDNQRSCDQRIQRSSN